jgi:hypothetical protein
MLRKGLALLTMALLAAPLFADVELSTSISDVFNRGNNELAGSITMSVNDNDFNNASTSEPVFIRVTLDHNAVLARTLVNTGSTDPAINLPIFLAMRLNRQQSVLQTLNASSETVSIVRWVAGDREFWIRVQQSSREWIEDGPGNIVPPRDELTVSWSLGISARESFVSNQNDFGIGGILNLPYNTRIPASPPTDVATNVAVSTLICVNLSNSILDSSGIESLLNFDPIAFDFTADQGGGRYGVGNITTANFTNDFSIARGRPRNCSVAIAEKGAFIIEPLCARPDPQNQTDNGQIIITNTISFILTCDLSNGALVTDFLPGSFIRFSTGSRGDYGFLNGNAALTNAGAGSSSVVVTNPNTSFNLQGQTLWREIDLIYTGGLASQSTVTGLPLTASVTVNYNFRSPPVDVTLDWEFTLVNSEGGRDVLDFQGVTRPFDGDDQFRGCDPSMFTFEEGSGEWAFGRFVECEGTPVVLFFPYLPQIVGNDIFFAGLSVVNQGIVDLEVQSIFYAEDGARYTADLPDLATRNLYTWLLADGDQGAGLYGIGDEDGVFIQPISPDAPVESFGTTRMSMFIRGTFEADSLALIDGGDLDGYLLLGRQDSIDGAYLPRNYDNFDPNPNQAADLPINRFKVSEQGTFVRPASGQNPIIKESPAKYIYEGGRVLKVQ